MKRWELVFPISAFAIVAWATIPDLAHFCGFLEFSRTCGLGWIFRLDVLLPAISVLAIWGWVRTAILWRYVLQLMQVQLKLMEERKP